MPQAFRRDGAGYAGSYLTAPWRQLRGSMPLAPEPADPGGF